MGVPAPINLNKKALTDMLPLKKKKNHDGSILASLSPETPMHRYQGRKLLDVVTRREDLLVNDRDDTQSQYLIFSHIDERTLLTEPLNEDRDDSELDLLIHHYKEFSLNHPHMMFAVQYCVSELRAFSKDYNPLNSLTPEKHSRIYY